MRLCRYEHQGKTGVAFYRDATIVPFHAIAGDAKVSPLDSDDLLPYLPHGARHADAQLLASQAAALPDAQLDRFSLPVSSVKLLVPIPRPPKLLLLAGNYTKHVEERGGVSAERRETFPYVFMKPPSTTLTHPGDPIRIPAVSPNEIDWELELGVIIGRRCTGVPERKALDYVAGYTVVNDISDRAFHPNPQRVKRPRDEHFDWLHGKWHDTFCPLGPCVLPADAVPDPQQFPMTLRVNGQTEQQGSTGQMVFPVAAVIEFISSFVTLEPGDVISTGTPHGVGKAKGKFLRPGDMVEAEIAGIGVLRNPVVG